jgi:hypothetical protein
MIWFIVAVVTGAAAFGGQPHEFASEKHFDTQEACEAYIPADADELTAELKSLGINGPFRIVSHCEIDTEAGEPV